MRRLSTVFLLCFVALLIGLGGMVAWKVRARRPPPPPPPMQEADYRIREVHINETLEGNLRWTLDADQAEVFAKEQRTVMRKVVVQVFSQGAVWTVTADEGTLDNEKRDISVQGNVVVTSNDGLRITTPELSWRNKERHLYTDEVVEIKRPGTTITGRGLDVRMQEQEAVVGKNVKVVIENRANANLALFPRSGL
ncbi:MAG: LPS export ABC transporter periplasmic protein LptC [Candidatus Rokubacteria bacterium]|nr:LPS export ABC transporter periplasmic protein LptC [Candidatus Rokubacteria bacterium]